MKKKLFLAAIVALTAACTSSTQPNEPGSNDSLPLSQQAQTAQAQSDFDRYTWNSTLESVTQTEAPAQGRLMGEGIQELEFEGRFLGVETNLDDNRVARKTFVFDTGQLKAGFFYLYTQRQLFDHQAHQRSIEQQLGQATQSKSNPEQGTKAYLWDSGPSTVVKLVIGESELTVRYEWYFYEKNWFDARKADLTKELQ